MKELLKEWKQYSEYHELFENHEYIEHVLGIKPLLNESGVIHYSSEIRNLIIQEHLLLEGFFGDIKQVGSDMISLAKIMKEVISDPNRLASWRQNLIKVVIKKPLAKIYNLINTMIEKLPQLNMPTFAKFAEQVKGLLDKFSEKIKAAEGWKGGMFLTGAALAVRYVWENIGEFVDAANNGLGGIIKKLMGDEAEERKEGLKEQLTEFLNEKIVNPIKEFLIEKIKGAIGAVAFDSIAGWLGWAKKAFDGASFISSTLSLAMSKQNVKLAGA